MAFRQNYVGRETEVIIERAERSGETVIGGLTDTYLRVDLPHAPRDADGLRVVKVTGVSEQALVGELVQPKG